jgi:hypothetical protein
MDNKCRSIILWLWHQHSSVSGPHYLPAKTEALPTPPATSPTLAASTLLLANSGESKYKRCADVGKSTPTPSAPRRHACRRVKLDVRLRAATAVHSDVRPGKVG